jgi:hypothetical protein
MVLIFSVCLFTIPAIAADDVKVILDGTELAFDVPPQIINGRTMVPMRKIFELLGAVVEWDEATKTVTATKNETVIIMQIGNATISVSGEDITLDVPPQIVNSRTLVPLRAVAEGLEANVSWDIATRSAIIKSKPEDADSRKGFPVDIAESDNQLDMSSVKETLTLDGVKCVLEASVSCMDIAPIASLMDTGSVDEGFFILAKIAVLNDKGKDITVDFYIGRVWIAAGTDAICSGINENGYSFDQTVRFIYNWEAGTYVNIVLEITDSKGNTGLVKASKIKIKTLQEWLQDSLGSDVTVDIK